MGLQIVEGTTVIRSRAPLRLGLAGGGTDVSPYCDEFGGAILNATIGLYASATAYLGFDNQVCFIATDLRQEEWLTAADAFPLNDGLVLHRAVYNRIIRDFNDGRPLAVRLITRVDTPPGSGLGSSSALVVAMVEAFTKLLRLPLGEYDVARLAYEIERYDAGLNGGRQDQYAATFGGVNFMEFSGNDQVLVNPLRINPEILNEFETSLVLLFSGVSRESAKIIDQQSAAVRSSNQRSIDAMHQLKKDAVMMKEALLRGELRRVAEILGHSWNEKKALANGITNEHIECLFDVAMRAGARAGKVSGAGGGGFLMFITEPVDRDNVVRALRDAGGEIVHCRFTSEGSTAWRVPAHALLSAGC